MNQGGPCKIGVLLALVSGWAAACGAASSEDARDGGSDTDRGTGNVVAPDAQAPPRPPGQVSKLAVGSSHTCVLLSGGHVKCWGVSGLSGVGMCDAGNEATRPDEMGNRLPLVNLGTSRTAIDLVAGHSGSCAVLDTGQVKCWGNENLRMRSAAVVPLSSDAMGDALGAVYLGSGVKATRVEAGTASACALLEDGTVKCWGALEFGAAGMDYTDPAPPGDGLPAVNLGTGRTVKEISNGNDHVCALLDNGQIKCWGYGDEGQLGTGDMDVIRAEAKEMGDNLPAVPLGEKATAVTAGAYHSCALLESGAVVCWGRNKEGQLGTGDTVNRGNGTEGTLRLSPVALGAGRRALAVDAGCDHTCALLDTRQVKCWGNGARGALGQGDLATVGDQAGEMEALPPIALGTGRVAQAIGAGTSFSCALLDEGEVKCWGANQHGQLGLGDQVDRGGVAEQMGDDLPRVDLGEVAASDRAYPNWPVTDLAMGDEHSCAVFDNGRAKCWGSNLSGQVMGSGNNAAYGDSLPHLDIGSGRTVRSLGAGAAHTCVVADTAEVKCWGDNRVGQLGQGDTRNRGDDLAGEAEELGPVDLGAGAAALQVVAGAEHSCALLSGGDVKCWGGNRFGQLGQGDSRDRGNRPDEMGEALAAVALGGAEATALVSGRFHTCALLGGGKVKCWGANDAGQLGLGDARHRGLGPGEMGPALPFVDLGAGRVVTALAAGGATTCALLEGGAVKCWGANATGQLGLGDTRSRGLTRAEMGDGLAPVNLPVHRPAIAIAVGGAHACAVLQGGELHCWGANDHGQLGLGDTLDRGDSAEDLGPSLPSIDLGFARFAVSVAAGRSHTCAILDTADVKCWGQGGWDEIGASRIGPITHRDVGTFRGDMGDHLPTVQLGTTDPWPWD
jgi:alpha-tubulin suppressor-like RCC1 family protein